MKTRLSPGFTRIRALRRIAFWTAMAVAAAFLVSLFVGTQRPPTAPSISYPNHLDAELAAGAPPKPAAARARAPRQDVSGLKLIPVVAHSGIKRVELLEKMPPEEGLMHANFTAPAAPAAPAARPEPTLGWGAWNQAAPEGISGPGGIRHIPGLTPTLTASSLNTPGENSSWHHGHFDGGLEAHQHGRAHHKAHPRLGGR